MEKKIPFDGQNSTAFIFAGRSAEFYISSRVLFFQSLFIPSFMLSAYCIEHILKALILFHNPGSNVIKFKHNLHKLANEVHRMGLQDLSSYIPFAETHALVFSSRYPPGPNSGGGFSLSKTELDLIDQVYLEITDTLPIRPDILVRSALFGRIYHYGKRYNDYYKWVSLGNRSFSRYQLKWDQLVEGVFKADH